MNNTQLKKYQATQYEYGYDVVKHEEYNTYAAEDGLQEIDFEKLLESQVLESFI
jgi:protein-disulfide isomerase-like protein with CxxC motif